MNIQKVNQTSKRRGQEIDLRRTHILQMVHYKVPISHLKIPDSLNVQMGFMLLRLSSLYFTAIWILEAVTTPEIFTYVQFSSLMSGKIHNNV